RDLLWLKFARTVRGSLRARVRGRAARPAGSVAVLGIVDAMASRQSIHQYEWEGEMYGPQQLFAGNDAAGVRCVLWARHVRAGNGCREWRPAEKSANRDGDRRALRPIRGRGRAQGL